MKATKLARVYPLVVFSTILAVCDYPDQGEWDFINGCGTSNLTTFLAVLALFALYAVAIRLPKQTN
jgi:hypothetical protein